MKRWRRRTKVLLALVAFHALAGGAALEGRRRKLFELPEPIESYFDPIYSGRSCPPNFTRGLKEIASAQADFRGNDRDGDGLQEFWRDDISGLYGLIPHGWTEMTKLICTSTAGADIAPIGRHPAGTLGPAQVRLTEYAVPGSLNGYWFRAIHHADETPDTLSRQRFAVCAFPARHSRYTRWTYIVDETYVIHKRDLGRSGGLYVFPDPDTLKRDWSKAD